jgi:hypothetical protein
MLSIAEITTHLWQINEWVWKDKDREKTKYLEKNLPHCHFVQHKFHVDWSTEICRLSHYAAVHDSVNVWCNKTNSVCVNVILRHVCGTIVAMAKQ